MINLQSSLEKDILTILLGNELYGLEILDRLNEEYRVMEFSSLYPALNRLEKYGFISWKWEDKSELSAGRKYYKVTDAGVFALTHSTIPEKKVFLRSKMLKLLEIRQEGSAKTFVYEDPNEKKNSFLEKTWNQLKRTLVNLASMGMKTSKEKR